MPRRIKVGLPPQTSDTALNRWMKDVTREMNILPSSSIISTADGPNSAYSGNSGDLVFDIGSSATTYWAKETGDDSQTGWASFQIGGDTAADFSSLRISSAQAMGNLGPATQIPFDLAGYSKNITADAGANQFNVPTAGDYKVNFDASGYENAGVATTITISLRINGNDTGIGSSTQLLSSHSRQMLGALSSVISLASNDSVSVFASSTAGTDDITLQDASFTIHQII